MIIIIAAWVLCVTGTVVFHAGGKVWPLFVVPALTLFVIVDVLRYATRKLIPAPIAILMALLAAFVTRPWLMAAMAAFAMINIYDLITVFTDEWRRRSHR